MKKALLFFICVSFFLFAYFNRYQPVSLDLVSPTTKTVEIKGEVKNPGIYVLKWEATLQDLIHEAGGYTENADKDTISLLTSLKDKDVIVIPKIGDVEIEKISINSATLEQLDTLPCIGPAIAQRIIDYRATTSFTSLEQIMEVKGIGDKLYEKIKDLITL